MVMKHNSVDIYPIPPIPYEIKQAVSNGKLLVFIGAGVSRIIGCSGWDELAIRLVDSAYEEGKINYQEKEKIIKEYGPRKTVTISEKILPKEVYKETLSNSLKAQKKKLGRYPIYEELFKLRGIFLTTNIDTYFDKLFNQEKIFNNINWFKPENISPLSLFHLHGSIKNFDTIIFTTQKYIEHYNKKEIREFLEHIFNTDFTVLFLVCCLINPLTFEYLFCITL